VVSKSAKSKPYFWHFGGGLSKQPNTAIILGYFWRTQMPIHTVYLKINRQYANNTSRAREEGYLAVLGTANNPVRHTSHPISR